MGGPSVFLGLVLSQQVEICFVRHAEPAWSVAGVNQHDPFLTPRGHRQAQLLADRLASEPAFTELVVSTSQRTRQTAEPVADALDLEPRFLDDLVEFRMPDLQGSPAETVEKIFREAYRRPPEEWWDGLPGGESFRQFHDRVSATVLSILDGHGIERDEHTPTHLWRMGSPEERLVIVGHGGTNAVALGFLLGVEPTPWEWERFVLGHAAIARLVSVPLAGEHILSMRSFNDQEHLPANLRTR